MFWQMFYFVLRIANPNINKRRITDPPQRVSSMMILVRTGLNVCLYGIEKRCERSLFGCK